MKKIIFLVLVGVLMVSCKVKNKTESANSEVGLVCSMELIMTIGVDT